MERWRITILGKLVLSLPIKEPSEYPSNRSEGVWQQGKREKLVFCYVLLKRVLCKLNFQFCARGLVARGTEGSNIKWIQV
jgi:hypothetical protein